MHAIRSTRVVTRSGTRPATITISGPRIEKVEPYDFVPPEIVR